MKLEENPILHLSQSEIEAYRKFAIKCDEHAQRNLTKEKLVQNIRYQAHPLDLGQKFAEQVPRENIKFLTQNMYMLPEPAGGHTCKDLRNLEFVRSVLPQYDICCLQETFISLNCRKEDLITLGALAGFPYYGKSARPGLFTPAMTDGGLLTLSRFPIEYSEFQPYPYGVFSDSVSQKGVLYTRIHI